MNHQFSNRWKTTGKWAIGAQAIEDLPYYNLKTAKKSSALNGLYDFYYYYYYYYYYY